MKTNRAYKIYDGTPFQIKDHFNRPTGKAWRKYQKLWVAYIKDVDSCNDGYFAPSILSDDAQDEYFQARSKQVKAMGLREQTIITKEALHKFFGGKITDWDYLLQFAEAMSQATFEYDVEKPFSYELIKGDTIHLNLGLIPPDLEDHYDE
jgi:hypothetical protein